MLGYRQRLSNPILHSICWPFKEFLLVYCLHTNKDLFIHECLIDRLIFSSFLTLLINPLRKNYNILQQHNVDATTCTIVCIDCDVDTANVSLLLQNISEFQGNQKRFRSTYWGKQQLCIFVGNFRVIKCAVESDREGLLCRLYLNMSDVSTIKVKVIGKCHSRIYEHYTHSRICKSQYKNFYILEYWPINSCYNMCHTSLFNLIYSIYLFMMNCTQKGFIP